MGAEFDLITIGGGSGGVAAARRAAMHGARVMLIERDRMGGTCVMRGCVPKKLLMYASQFRTFYELGGAFGWSFGSAQFDMRQWQAAKAGELDRLELVYRSLLEQVGVQVVNGSASIVNPHCVLVGDRQFACRQLLIATGSSPATAPVPGLDTALTSEDILNLQAVPKRLAVVGAGYIGVEFASMFAKLGSEVTLIFREPHPLKSFDADLRRRLSTALEQEGVKLQPQTTLQSVVKKQDSYRLVCHNGQELSYDAILNATGRMPNTEGLHLEELGIALNGSGAIPVDHYSRTAVSNVYAVGDVTNRKNLTPVAIAEGRAFADTVFGKEDRGEFNRSVQQF